MNSRHAMLASDSERLCVVVPKTMASDIHSLANERGVTASYIVREFITVMVEKEKRNV